MNGKQLKNSILQWAIQGKLVPQDPNDEPASELLKRIREEKARLVKEKKIKRDKNESIIYRGGDNSYYEKIIATGEVKCIDEEIPFEIPNGWEWCRLSAIAISITDGDHMPPPKSNDGIPFLVISNIAKGVIDFNDTRFVPNSYYDKLSTDRRPQVNDVLFSVTGSYGIAVLVSTNNVFCFQRHIAIIRPIFIDSAYCELVLNSPFVKSQCDDKATGMAQKTVGIDSLRKFLIPMPPLGEQVKIIHLIRNIEPLIKRYIVLEEQKNKINYTIYELLKKSILQEAIKGKLVPQIDEEGTAEEMLEQIKQEKQKLVKEGKLKKSALIDSVIFKGDDNKYYERIDGQDIEIELPFDFPLNWIVLRLKDICQLIDGEKKVGKGICLDAKYLRGKSTATIMESGKYVYKGENIILVDGENSGEVFTVPLDGYMGSTFKQLWLSKAMHKPYILAFIMFYKDVFRNSKKGAAIPHLNKELFYNLYIGIPPLREQQRIAKRIEDLLKFLK